MASLSEMPLRCEVCQSLVDEEDLFCANCGTEIPPRAALVDAVEVDPSASEPLDAAAGAAVQTTDAVVPPAPAARAAPAAASSRVSTFNFECPGCGASMSYDARERNLRCPFCGSLGLRPKPDARVLAPQRICRFEVQQADAEQALRAWLQRGFFRPGDLAARAAIVAMQPVYVPYWVFAAETNTYYTADSSATPAHARADWYPVSGVDRAAFRDVLVGASGALTPAETQHLLPFALERGVPPEEVDLDPVTVEQFSVPRKYARPLARSAIESLEASRVAQQVPGRARNVHVNVRFQAMASDPVLLPIWISAYRYRDQVHRFLVNGQTGKVVGTAPVSYWRITGVVVAVAIVVLAIVLLIAALAGGRSRRAPFGGIPARPPAVAAARHRAAATKAAERTFAVPPAAVPLSPGTWYTASDSPHTFTFGR